MTRITCCVSLLTLLLAACGAPPRVFKLALVAPFEGHHREVGYGVFPGFRDEVQAQIARRAGRSWQVTFVAYNDNADPADAARVARNVIADPDVLMVLGHWLPDTTAASAPAYAAAGLAHLQRCDDVRPTCMPADIAVATRNALALIESAAGQGVPSRAAVHALVQR
jgi:hypothetical protein